MIPPGAEPHTYEPKPRQLSELSVVDIFFTIGDTFESAWLNRFRAVNPSMRIEDTGAAIPRIAMTGHADDHHGHEEEHDSLDPHIWLSPLLVKNQAKVVYNALVSMAPDHADDFAEGYREFIDEIESLDSELRGIFSDVGDKNRFIVFHPSWGYFADAYGLLQIPIEVDGREPTSAEMMRLITFAKEQGITVVFVQPQFSGRSAGVIAREIGGAVIAADPLAEDWSSNLRAVAREMRKALK